MFNPFAAIEKAIDLALTLVVLVGVAAIAIVIGFLALYVSNNLGVAFLATFVTLGIEFNTITHLVD